MSDAVRRADLLAWRSALTVRSHIRSLSSKLDAHSKLEILARSAELGVKAI